MANYCFDLRFYKPKVEQVKGAMMSIGKSIFSIVCLILNCLELESWSYNLHVNCSVQSYWPIIEELTNKVAKEVASSIFQLLCFKFKRSVLKFIGLINIIMRLDFKFFPLRNWLVSYQICWENSARPIFWQAKCRSYKFKAKILKKA